MSTEGGHLARAVGANLRADRTRLGLTQEQMADHLGVRRGWYAAIERGQRNISLRTVERYAERLGLDDPAGLFWPRA